MKPLPSLASSAGFALVLTALVFLLNTAVVGVAGHVITAAPSLPTYTYDEANRLMGAQAPGHRLGKRQEASIYYTGTDCDGQGTWTCDTGTCYQGPGGFVGCCDVSSCLGRFVCMPATVSATDCDPISSGCLQCNAEAPECVFQHRAEHWVMYCDTVGGTTILTDMITGLPPMSSATSLHFMNQGGIISGASSFYYPGQWPFLDGSPAASTTSDASVTSAASTTLIASPSSAPSSASPTDIVIIFSASTLASSTTGSAVTTPDSSSTDSLSPGAIAAMVVGISLAGVALTVAITWFCLDRRRQTTEIPAQFPADPPLTPRPQEYSIRVPSPSPNQAPVDTTNNRLSHGSAPMNAGSLPPASELAPGNYPLTELESTSMSPVVSPIASPIASPNASQSLPCGAYGRFAPGSRYSVSSLGSLQRVSRRSSARNSAALSPGRPHPATPPSAKRRSNDTALAASPAPPSYQHDNGGKANFGTDNSAGLGLGMAPGQAAGPAPNNDSGLPSHGSSPYLSAEDALAGGFWRTEAEKQESEDGGSDGGQEANKEMQKEEQQ